jgi:hypothetical protein
MKGFVITLISTSLILVLVTLSASIYDSYRSMERDLIQPQSLTYAASLFDDVAGDVNDLAGLEIKLTQTNTSTGLFISDTVPKPNYTANLTAYESFLESTYANQTHAYIDVNFSNMSNALDLEINEDYRYTNDIADGDMLFTSSGGTGATAYFVNITVDEYRANLTLPDFNSSGDINLTLMYVDLNGTRTDSGKVFSHKADRLDVEFDGGGSLQLDIGPAAGNRGSLSLETDNVTAQVSWYVILPPIDGDKKFGYEYDATMEYVQGKVSMSRNIGK